MSVDELWFFKKNIFSYNQKRNILLLIRPIEQQYVFKLVGLRNNNVLYLAIKKTLLLSFKRKLYQ